MKTIKTFLLLFTFVLVAFTSNAQNYFMTSPEGYGAGATGGGTAAPITVTTSAALKTALTASGNGVILVSGTITTARLEVVVTNKTIIGLPGATLTNLDQTASNSGILYLKSGSSNVIIRNLIFVGPGAYDADGWDCLTNKGCTKLWVDHCDFQDGMDGNFDNTNDADNISITWCRFHYLKTPKAGGSGGTDDHRFTDLIGGSDSDAPSDGHYSITWQYCWWDNGCVERMPRARNAQLHLLNCYWNTKNGKVLLGLGGGSNGTTAYVESSVMAGSGTQYKNYDGTVALNFVNCSGVTQANVGTVSKPTYTYTVLPVGQLVSAITNASCGAGATLQVNAAGVISSSCSTPVLQPTLVLTSGSTAQTVTQNSPIASIVYTYGGSGTGATVTGLPAGVSATTNTSAKTITISGTPTATGTFNYTITTTQSSGTAVSLSGSIIVNAIVVPQPTLTLTSGAASQTITVGAAISNIVYTLGGSATGATVTGLPAGVTAIVSGTTVTISGTPTATGTSNFTVTTTQSSGTAVSLSGSIIVNAIVVPQPTLTLTSGTASQTITVGAAISNIVYTLGGSATGATVTGLPDGVTATTSGTTVTISGTPTATGTSSFTVTTTQSSGTAVSLSGSIIVNAIVVPQPTLTLTSGAASQTLTIGAAITNIVYTLGGSATGATVTGLPDGVTATTSGATVTISGTPTATGTSSFIVTTTQSSGTAVSLSGSIIVNEVIIITGATETFESLTSSILSTGSDKTQDLPINGLTWKVEKARLNTSSTFAHAGNNSIRLLYNTGALITPVLAGAQTFSFYVAGANASYTPKLAIYKSIDGGTTWVSTAILSTTVTSTSFKLISVTISETTNNVKLKISNLGGTSQTSSNNIYIDDVTFTAAPGARSAIIAYPSEATGEKVITVVQDANELTVSGVDVASLSVYGVSGSILASSKTSQNVNVSTLANGVYILQIQAIDGTVTSKKFIKQ